MRLVLDPCLRVQIREIVLALAITGYYLHFVSAGRVYT